MSLIKAYIEDAKYVFPGMILGVITGVIGNKIAIKFKLGIISRIVFQLILLSTVSFIVQRLTTNYIEDAPHGTGNFQTFFFGVQIFLFMDIARLFGMHVTSQK